MVKQSEAESDFHFIRKRKIDEMEDERHDLFAQIIKNGRENKKLKVEKEATTL